MELFRGALGARAKCGHALEAEAEVNWRSALAMRWKLVAGLLAILMCYATSAMADNTWCNAPYGAGRSYEGALEACKQEIAQDEAIGWINIQPCHLLRSSPWGSGGYTGTWYHVDQRTDDWDYIGGTVDFWCDGMTLPSAGKANGKPPAGNAKGDPINAGNGNVYREDEDFAAGWLAFKRYYNSDPSAGNGSFGSHWSYSYARQLTYTVGTTSGTGTVTLMREDGRVATYKLTGGVWYNEVDVPDALTEQTDANGNPTGWTVVRVDTRSTEQYDASGHLIAIQRNDGFTTTLTYSTASTPATVAPGPGYLISVTDPAQRTLQLVYNGSGLITQMVAPDGAAYGYTYNAAGQLQSVSYPGGGSVTYLYDETSNNGGATTTGLLTGVKDETANRYISYSYNASAKGTNSQFAGGVFSYTLTYNTDGSVDTLDPLGTTRHNTFTTLQGVPYIASSNGLCESCSSVSTWQYDFTGQLLQTTDFNGNVTTYQHDQNGLPNGRTEASGSSVPKQVQWDWDVNLFVPIEQRWPNYNMLLAAKTHWVYNTRGQPLVRCEIDVSKASSYTCAATGSVPAGVRRWTYTYCDAVGTGCPLVGLLLTQTGPRTDLVQTTTYSYYSSSSAVNCGTPGAACYQAGDLHTITDALGHVTTIASYDADGRITRVTDTNGVNTDMTYTPRGWLASRSVGGAATTFAYTPYGAVQTVTDPDSVTTTYGYDPAHRLVKVTDAQGNYIQYTLDGVGNKTAEQAYDSNGNLRKSLARTFNALGQLTKVMDGLSHTVFDATASGSYNANGNLVQSADGLGIQRQMGYDALNRLVQTLDNYNGTN